MPPSQSMNFASSRFVGVVLAVKARIRLCRSFDQISHQYQGYTLVMRGTVDDEDHDEFRIAVGPAAHKKNEFRIGDRLSGKTHLVADPRTEWAEFNRTSGLKFLDRGPDEHNRPADADGGIAPPVEVYRARGHVRLAKRTCETKCHRCPFGLTMATEIIIDQWNRDKKKWRFETHCYGPRDCPRYKSGPPRRVLGRQPGMVWIDDDLEREI